VKVCGLAAVALAYALGQPAAKPSAGELDELQRALAEANSSQIEVLRVIQKYLAEHPATAFRPDLDHRAAEAAIAVHDNALAVRYGEAALARTPDDTKLLPGVTHALLALETRDAAQMALQYARHAEDLVRKMQSDGNPGNVSPAEWRKQTDHLLNLALVDEARATGIVNRPEDALAIARRAFEVDPDEAAAREMAYWFERAGKLQEAIDSLADAFMIPDPIATGAQRAADRAHLGELYRKLNGSETGMGALCLQAYDRTAALLKARDANFERNEPNSGKTNVLDFTLSGLDGKSLALASLKGKVVVMDLWATWCIPCREQHPLYEEAKQRFRENPAVVFLSVNADADRSAVKPFVERMKWQGPVYFEDGLARLFAIEGLPATLLLDRNAQLYTHLNGFLDKNHFADLLTERIRDALAVPVK